MSDSVTLTKIVLIGASGNLGAIILPALLAAKTFQITILTRSKGTKSFPADVSVVETTYSEEELVEIFQGKDAVISAVGATGFAEQQTYVDAAIKAGVKRFMPSELSMNTLSKTVRELVPVFEPKKALLEYLKEKETTGMTWTGLATGPLLDWGVSTGFMGFDLSTHTATIWDDGRRQFSAINEGDLAKAVVAVLQHPTQTANRYLYVHTLVTTQEEILQSLEQVTGKKWSTQTVDTDAQVALGRQKVADGDFTGMYELVKASAWGRVPGINSNYPVEESLANAMLGLPEGSLIDTMKRVVGV